MMAWLRDNTLVSINIVDLRRARLILGWVTICGQETISVCSQPPKSTQPPTLCGTVKMSTILGLSNNDKWHT